MIERKMHHSLLAEVREQFAGVASLSTMWVLGCQAGIRLFHPNELSC